MLRTRLLAAGALVALLTASPAAAQQETLEVTFDLAPYQHPGSWSFSRGCTHTPVTGRNNWVHITVVWLEDMNGNYVTTLHRWGRSYLYDLKAWSTAAGPGLDGVTSATPTSDATDAGMVFKNFTTGVQNVSRLPDGMHRVRFESTQCELADGFRSHPNPNPFAGGTALSARRRCSPSPRAARTRATCCWSARRRSAAALGGPQGFILRQLANPTLRDFVLKTLGPRGRTFYPLFRNTASPTVLHGSSKINVIPGEISVELDGRLLPPDKPPTI